MNALPDAATDPTRQDDAPQARSLRADLSVVGAAALVSQALGIVTSLSLRGLLDPASMGVWQGLKLVLSYSNYANLGASKGAARELARAVGRGDPSAAAASVGHALSVNTLASGLVAAALLTAGAATALRGAGPQATTWAWGLAVTGGLVLLQRHVTYLVTLLRASQRFGATSRITICESVLTLGAAVGGVALWGLPGLYLATAIVLVATWSLARRAAPIDVQWNWDRGGAARMIQVGGPMLAAGALASLLRSLDKLAILSFAADREYQLGVYSLALMVTGQIHGATNLLGTVLLPRLSAEFGRVGCPRHVARRVVTATTALAPLAALGCVSALFLAEPLLGSLLPAYRAGLAPLVALLPGCAALALVVPVSQFQMAVGDERRALAIVAAATALTAAMDLAAMAWRPGLVTLAAATSAGYGLFFLASVLGSLWFRLEAGDRRRYAATLLAVVVIPLCGATAAHGLLPREGWPARGLAWAGIAAWIGGAWWLSRPREAERSLAWLEFERRCQKPDHRRVGTWLARRVARPAALRITWLAIPLGIRAHQATGLAWLTALGAAFCLGLGTPAAWLTAALLLQLWYLLDHVDGQLARWHGVASLDGVALDYLMHHSVALTTWFAAGWGVAAARGQPGWILVGACAAAASLLLALQNDVRYKAFFQRLKRVRGRLEVVNQRFAVASAPGHASRRLVHAIRKCFEMHVAMCVLGAASLGMAAAGDRTLALGAAWLAASCAGLFALLAFDVTRNLRRGAAEEEFARWFVPPAGHALTFAEGWYRVDHSASEAGRPEAEGCANPKNQQQRPLPKPLGEEASEGDRGRWPRATAR